MPRRTATITLLRSRTDWHPSIRSQFQGFGATPGEKATVWRLCGSCDGTGTLKTRKGDEACPKCQGKGRFLVDAYTGRRDGEQETRLFSAGDIRRRAELTDAAIARLKEQTAPPRSEADLIADAQPFPWERERDRYYRAGDYRALDLALEWLDTHNPDARDLVCWVYETGIDELGCLDESILLSAERAADLLAERMPDPIRVPSWLSGEAPRRIVRRRAA